jgi:Caspase domain
VDTNIPSLQISNPHAYALIFGNEEYSRFQSGLGSEVNVAFAVNDATVFRKYCMSVFGVPESNVKFYANATGGQMNQAIAWINKLIQKEAGEAEVIVYYAGHGLPDEQTREPYIIPVDVSGADLQSAIKLQVLYRKLTEFPSKKITVFMDACFSGGSRGAGLLATRGVKVKPKENALEGNIVVFTSSSGEQSSMPFKEKQHGIFTYYLLKRIQETAGNTSYEELYNYVKKEVDLNCVKVNSKEQTPNLLYPTDLGDNWKAWKLR